MNENRSLKSRKQKTEWIQVVAVLIVILLAWFVGRSKKNKQAEPFLPHLLPNADYFQPDSGGFIAWKNGKNKTELGFIFSGKSHGYGGEIVVLTAINTIGAIENLVIIDHKETYSFMRRVVNKGLLQSLIGKKYSDGFMLDQDVDSVTGATYTSRGLAEAAMRGSRTAAYKFLNKMRISEPPPKIIFGIPEILLLFLFLTGLLSPRIKLNFRKTIRWISMLTGMLFLGFLYNQPLTIVIFNKILLGIWPQWQTYLYWYILLGGIFLMILLENHNGYCGWFCPFGAVQECLALIGGGKIRYSKKAGNTLRWFQRSIALALIVSALVFRNPSKYNYEVFGAAFHLIGTSIIFGLLGIVLISSLFFKRPWCKILCPLRPVTDYLKLIRNLVKAPKQSKFNRFFFKHRQ